MNSLILVFYEPYILGYILDFFDLIEYNKSRLISRQFNGAQSVLCNKRKLLISCVCKIFNNHKENIPIGLNLITELLNLIPVSDENLLFDILPNINLTEESYNTMDLAYKINLGIIIGSNDIYNKYKKHIGFDDSIAARDLLIKDDNEEIAFAASFIAENYPKTLIKVIIEWILVLNNTRAARQLQIWLIEMDDLGYDLLAEHIRHRAIDMNNKCVYGAVYREWNDWDDDIEYAAGHANMEMFKYIIDLPHWEAAIESIHTFLIRHASSEMIKIFEEKSKFFLNDNDD